MGLVFEWNAAKARSNAAKHAISFEEATTVFGDPLSMTMADPDRATGEARYVTMGLSTGRRLLAVVHTERGDTIRIISARRATRHERRAYEGRQGPMKKRDADDEVWEMRPEYDFSEGVRGKYAERYAAGTNVVALDPDVAAAFSSSKAVNNALRRLLQDRQLLDKRSEE